MKEKKRNMKTKRKLDSDENNQRDKGANESENCEGLKKLCSQPLKTEVKFRVLQGFKKTSYTQTGFISYT